MSKNRKWLIGFLRRKNEIFSKYKIRTNPSLSDIEDFKDINLWNESQLYEIYNHISKEIDDYLKHNIPITASDICPWCIVSYKCEECTYAKRNIQCKSYDSKYNKIINNIVSSFFEDEKIIKYMSKGVKKENNYV